MTQAALLATRPRRPTLGPTAWVAAGFVAIVTTVSAMTAAPALARSGDPAYRVSGVSMTAADLLVLLGVISLARSGAVRPGWLRRISFGLAIAGSAGVVLAEVLLRTTHDTGNAVFGVVGPVQAIGFIGAGVGILLTHTWTSCGDSRCWRLVCTFPPSSFPHSRRRPPRRTWWHCWDTT